MYNHGIAHRYHPLTYARATPSINSVGSPSLQWQHIDCTRLGPEPLKPTQVYIDHVKTPKQNWYLGIPAATGTSKAAQDSQESAVMRIA
jgi:hypothetical protein